MGVVLGIVITLLLLVPISKATAKTIFAFLRQVIRYDTTGKWSIYILNFCGLPLFYLSIQDELFILACENQKFAVLKWFAERVPVKSYATYMNAWNSRKTSSTEYPQVDDVFILIDAQYKKAFGLNAFGSNPTFLSLAARDGDLSFATRLILHDGKEQNDEKDRAMLEACSCSCATLCRESCKHSEIANILLDNGACSKPTGLTGKILESAFKLRPTFDNIILRLADRGIQWGSCTINWARLGLALILAAKEGDVDFFILVMKHENKALYSQGEFDLAMMEASKKSLKAIVSHLIDSGKTSLSKYLFDSIYNQRPFFDDVIIRFAQARSKLQLVGDMDSTLSWTLKQNEFDLALFTRMLDEVTFIDGEKSEALNVACQNKHVAPANLLLSRRITPISTSLDSPAQRGFDISNALMYAFKSNNTNSIIDFGDIIFKLADQNAVTSKGETALELAVDLQNAIFIERLLKHVGATKFVGKEWDAAFNRACSRKCGQIAILLLKEGIIHIDTSSALEIAWKVRLDDVVLHLTEMGAVDSEGNSAIVLAASIGDETLLTRFLKNGSLSFDTIQKELAITIACRGKHKAVAEKLLKEPYNFPATSAAIDAAFSSRPGLDDVIVILSNRGIKSSQNKSALELAVNAKDTQFVLRLLEGSGGCLDEKTTEVVNSAAEHACGEMMAFVEQNKHRYELWNIALACKASKLALSFILFGARPHLEPLTLVHLLFASLSSSEKDDIVSIQVEALLSMGVDEDFRFTLPSTPRSQGFGGNNLAKFMSALKGAQTSGIAQQLGALIAESNKEDESPCGPTALFLAAKLGRYDSVRHLLDAGADFGIRYLDINDKDVRLSIVNELVTDKSLLRGRNAHVHQEAAWNQICEAIPKEQLEIRFSMTPYAVAKLKNYHKVAALIKERSGDDETKLVDSSYFDLPGLTGSKNAPLRIDPSWYQYLLDPEERHPEGRDSEERDDCDSSDSPDATREFVEQQMRLLAARGGGGDLGRGVAEWLATKPRASDALSTFQRMMMDGLSRATGRPNIICRTSHPKLSVHTSLEIEGEGPTSNRTFFFKLVTWPGSMEYPNFERGKIRKVRRETLVATTFYCRAGSTVTIFAPRTKCWLKFCLGPDGINDMDLVNYCAENDKPPPGSHIDCVCDLDKKTIAEFDFTRGSWEYHMNLIGSTGNATQVQLDADLF